MSEFNAILGLATLKHADEEVKIRNDYAEIYREELTGVPGVIFQDIQAGSRSSFKDFTIAVDETEFGATRDELHIALGRMNIDTKKYFDPPLHRQSAYRNREFRQSQMANTEFLSKHAITLPMYSSMGPGAVSRVCGHIRDFQSDKAITAGENLTI
jgi:dTDP-4-amino-4,6-dideoxygalactose transaminase